MTNLRAPRTLTTLLAASFVVLSSAAFAQLAPEAAKDKPDAPVSPSVPAAKDDASDETLTRDLLPIQKPLYELGGLGNSQGRIGVDAWVDRKDLTYKVGSAVRIGVTPKRDAYITILDVGTSGRVAVVYPNHFQRDARVKGGETIAIPAENAKWNFELGGPTGVELIKVIASREPLTLKELEKLAGTTEKEPVLTLGRSAEEAARDLIPQLKPTASDHDEPNYGVRNVLFRVKKPKTEEE